MAIRDSFKFLQFFAAHACRRSSACFNWMSAGEIFAVFPTAPHTSALRVACWRIGRIGGIQERPLAEALLLGLVKKV